MSTYEMNIVRDDKTIANEINFIKRRTCEAVLSASVEIGRLLCEAKFKVPGGEWMKWLEDNVSYSQSTANNLMRLYKEYGEQSQIGFFEENRLEIFGDITPSQALALVALPYAERKEFVENHDMENTSVRDIEAEIKARKEAEERADKAEAETKRLTELVASKEEDEKDYAANIEELEAELEKTRNQLNDIEPHESVLEAERAEIKKQLDAEYAEKLKTAEKEAKAKAEKKIAELKDKLATKDTDFEKKLAEETEKAKLEAKAVIESEYKAKIEGLLGENSALKKRADMASNADVQKFSVHFELFQKEGQLLLTLLPEISSGDEALGAKLKAGLRKVLEVFDSNLGQEEKCNE